MGNMKAELTKSKILQIEPKYLNWNHLKRRLSDILFVTKLGDKILIIIGKKYHNLGILGLKKRGRLPKSSKNRKRKIIIEDKALKKQTDAQPT